MKLCTERQPADLENVLAVKEDNSILCTTAYQVNIFIIIKILLILINEYYQLTLIRQDVMCNSNVIYI